MSISRVFDAYVATRDVPNVEATFGELDFVYGCATQGVEDESEAIQRASELVFAQLVQDAGDEAAPERQGISGEDPRLLPVDTDPTGGEI